jgi:hypothetical protein
MEFLKRIGEELIEMLAEEFRLQGHSMDGTFEKEMEYQVTGNSVKIYGMHYAKYIDKGVQPQNIPYSPGTRSGAKKSKYIQGLADYVLKRMGVGGAQGLSIAFAIAKTQKREGMPTDNSHKYSQTGQRTGFIDAALIKNDRQLTDMIDSALTDHVKKIIKQW